MVLPCLRAAAQRRLADNESFRRPASVICPREDFDGEGGDMEDTTGAVSREGVLMWDR